MNANATKDNLTLHVTMENLVSIKLDMLGFTLYICFGQIPYKARKEQFVWTMKLHVNLVVKQAR